MYALSISFYFSDCRAKEAAHTEKFQNFGSDPVPVVQNHKAAVECPMDGIEEIGVQFHKKRVKQDPVELAILNGDSDMIEEGEIREGIHIMTAGGDSENASFGLESPGKKEDAGGGSDGPMDFKEGFEGNQGSGDLRPHGSGGGGDDEPPDKSNIEMPPTIHSDMARKRWQTLPHYLKQYVTRINNNFMKECQSLVSQV